MRTLREFLDTSSSSLLHLRNLIQLASIEDDLFCPRNSRRLSGPASPPRPAAGPTSGTQAQPPSQSPSALDLSTAESLSSLWDLTERIVRDLRGKRRPRGDWEGDLDDEELLLQLHGGPPRLLTCEAAVTEAALELAPLLVAAGIRKASLSSAGRQGNSEKADDVVDFELGLPPGLQFRKYFWPQVVWDDDRRASAFAPLLVAR